MGGLGVCQKYEGGICRKMLEKIDTIATNLGCDTEKVDYGLRIFKDGERIATVFFYAGEYRVVGCNLPHLHLIEYCLYKGNIYEIKQCLIALCNPALGLHIHINKKLFGGDYAKN